MICKHTLVESRKGTLECYEIYITIFKRTAKIYCAFINGNLKLHGYANANMARDMHSYGWQFIGDPRTMVFNSFKGDVY